MIPLVVAECGCCGQFLVVLWAVVERNIVLFIFCVIFKVELQKPGQAGGARETVRFICATQPMRVWHPWALDGEAGAIKPVLRPYCMLCSFTLSTLMYGALTGSRSGKS